MYDIKVYINNGHSYIGKEVFIICSDASGMKILKPDFKTWETASPLGEAQVPTVVLYPDIYNAFVQHILKTERPNNSTFVEGKLMGTEKHLEDLRLLLKLNDKKEDKNKNIKES